MIKRKCLSDAMGNKLQVGDEVSFYAVCSWEAGVIVKFSSECGQPIAIIVRDDRIDDMEQPYRRFTKSIERL